MTDALHEGRTRARDDRIEIFPRMETLTLPTIPATSDP